jgi:secreted trypsin-like serine protease
MKNIVWYIFSVCLFTALTFYYNWIERHTMAVKYLKAKKLYHSNYHLHWN